MRQKICAVILAGGKSSRMGKDKSLLEFSNYSTMSEFQYKKLNKLFNKVYISSKIDKFDFLKNKELLILDKTDTFSPMVALDSIFNNISEEKVFIITVDNPLVTIEVIYKLIEISQSSNNEIVIAKDTKGNRHSLCGVFNSSIHKQVKNCLAQDIHKINYLINNCDHKEVLFDNYKQFININTQEDYIKAKEQLKNT